MNKGLLFLLAQLLVVHAQPKTGETLTEYLWSWTTKYQQEALNSNYVYGVTKGCLNPTQFAGYNVEDAAYLYYNAKNMKTAAGRSNDNATVQNFLNEQSTKWTGYWDWMREPLHIANADGIAMGEEVKAYVDHIKSVAEDQALGPVYTILALTPCAKLWPWLGEQIGSGTKNFGVYTEWVDTNFDPQSTGYKKYEDYVNWAYEAGKVDVSKAMKIFTTSIEGEVKFFNSVDRCNPNEYDDRNWNWSNAAFSVNLVFATALPLLLLLI